jgi:hypothetical protein
MCANGSCGGGSCGGIGQACCGGGTTCTAAGVVCLNGTCVACGGAGERCCYDPEARIDLYCFPPYQVTGVDQNLQGTCICM